MGRSISKSKRRRIYEKSNFRCNYCGVETTKHDGKHSPTHAVIDHIVPKSRGGGNEDDNLQLLCSTCNSRKGTKTMDEFIYYMKATEETNNMLKSMSVDVTEELSDALDVFQSRVPAKYRLAILRPIYNSFMSNENKTERVDVIDES